MGLRWFRSFYALRNVAKHHSHQERTSKKGENKFHFWEDNVSALHLQVVSLLMAGCQTSSNEGRIHQC